MSQSSTFTLVKLDSASIPLTGTHLIEASAGTGKTYNITRIYLRLLLERELTVEEILLMTFTNDATQELKGRIDTFIRDALKNWQALCETDEFFKTISARVKPEKVMFLLKRALLYLDEAAIFTIHGFCQRALTQHAFASGLPFNANMTTNSNELVLEATQDWYRKLAKKNTEGYLLVEQFWSTPSNFVTNFNKAISHRSEISILDVQSLVDNFTQLARIAYKAILNNEALLDEGVIAHKKPEEQQKRAEELVKLSNWLDLIGSSENEEALLVSIENPIPDYLLNGNRHKKAFKSQLLTVLKDAKELKVQLKDLNKKINKAKAFNIVREGIYQIRQQVKQSKTQLNCLDFDDLINTLADSLINENPNTLAQTLLGQYPVALVDEFQDTDPQQFLILQKIYYHEQQAHQSQLQQTSNALYLIGDPKQAIYGFRGGDIFAYLNARNSCDYHWLMDTNWRSSPAMVSGYNQVFVSDNVNNKEIGNPTKQNDSVFGYGIEYQAVLAGKKSESSSVNNDDRALQFIHFAGDDNEKSIVQTVRPFMASWCAEEIVKLLKNQKNEFNKPLKRSDIAILVRDGREAEDIKEALFKANLASVFLSDRTNLFESEQAKQLLQLLKGILYPDDERQFVNALTCGLLGINAIKLYALQQDESAYQKLKFKFFNYREQWQRQGFITMAISMLHQHFDFSIVNAQGNKARSLTNLLHLFEVLQSTSQKFLQPEELIYWFEQQCNEVNNFAINTIEAEQRLESDGDLIRIVTQHGAKGLEYPVVFISFATRHKDPLKFGNTNVNYIEYHDNQGQLSLSLDGDEKAKKAMADETYAESIRLLYVAITRAKSRCYILTAAFQNYADSPLGKTLQWQADENIAQSLQRLVDKSPDSISLQIESLGNIDKNSNVELYRETFDVNHDELTVSKFNGIIERDWWLSSFSALSKNLRHGGVSSPDRDSAESIEFKSKQLIAIPLLRFQLAKGAHSGNLLHNILEVCNFKNSEDTNNNLLESIKWPLVKYGELTTGFTELDLFEWLNEILNTPLLTVLPIAASSDTDAFKDNDRGNNFCLSDIPLNQTLRESEFYFPMEKANITDLEQLLTDHRNTDKDIVNYNRVRLPSYKTLHGMMHGFIDLVFENNGKYYVCDYKSSHLGDDFSDYCYDDLRHNIETNHYDLQYLIYSLALHRYLKENVNNYSVEEHFGGIYYLYLRGMTTNLAHKNCGVYYRRITSKELFKLDNIFSGNKLNKELS